jgi:hypothetical protein
MTATLTRRWRAPLPTGRRDAVVAVAAAALLVRTLATVVTNAPGGVSGIGGDPLLAVSTGVAALAAVGVALTVDDPVAGVGLLFVGVFGLLSTLTGAVALPAAVAVGGGTAAVAAAVASRRSLPPATAAAGGLLLVALVVSLVGGVGGAASLRAPASTLALLGVAGTPVFAATTGRTTLAGTLAFAAVLAVGLANPFVTGAVTLVGGGVVGTSLPVVALAVGGAVTAGSVAARRGEWCLLAGVALVALAGVPATLARAVPFALGVATLALREAER